MAPQEVHESSSSSFFEMRSTTCNKYAQFLENKLSELNNLCNEAKGLFCGGLMCGEIRHFQKFGCGNSPFTTVYLR